MPRIIVFKVLKTSNKEKIVKAARGRKTYIYIVSNKNKLQQTPH